MRDIKFIRIRIPSTPNIYIYSKSEFLVYSVEYSIQGKVPEAEVPMFSLEENFCFMPWPAKSKVSDFLSSDDGQF